MVDDEDLGGWKAWETHEHEREGIGEYGLLGDYYQALGYLVSFHFDPSLKSAYLQQVLGTSVQGTRVEDEIAAAFLEGYDLGRRSSG